VAGALINQDYKSEVPPGFPDHFPVFFPISDALLNVNSRYQNLRPGIARGEAMCLGWGAVAPDGPFARRGIASVLIRLSVELAVRHGSGRCVAECTGHYSQQAARRAGFQPMARVSYREHRFQGRPVFRSIPAPHAELLLLERVLAGGESIRHARALARA